MWINAQRYGDMVLSSHAIELMIYLQNQNPMSCEHTHKKDMPRGEIEIKPEVISRVHVLQQYSLVQVAYFRLYQRLCRSERKRIGCYNNETLGLLSNVLLHASQAVSQKI
jgi:hypothetical protein